MATLTPLRYRGYVYDVETGLYYLQSRYYNPELGRFISPDAVYDTDAGIQGYNIFLYCANNPVNRIDISGADSEPVADLDLTNDVIEDKENGKSGSNRTIPIETNTGGVSSPSSGEGSSGGNAVDEDLLITVVHDAINGLGMALGSKNSHFSEPRSPEKVSDEYIKSNRVDAHAFKQSAGKVPPGKLSRYNIYKDKANHNRLWVGTNNTKNRDWRLTPYSFKDLAKFWRK